MCLRALFILIVLFLPEYALSQQAYKAGEVIVKLRSTGGTATSYAFLGKAHSEKSMNLKHSWNKFGMYHFAVSKGKTVEQTVEELRNDPDVEYVEPNYILTKADVGMEQTYSAQQVEQMVGAQAASTLMTTADIGLEQTWSMMSTSSVSAQSVIPIVAVIDTGLDLNHPVFRDSGAIYKNMAEVNGVAGVDDDGNGYVDDVNGWNFVDNTPTMYDDDGHGTHVSGIILGVGQNIFSSPYAAAKIRIMPLKFLDANGVGSTSDAIQAIYYAVRNGATVLNNSWGGPSYSAALHEAVAYSYQYGTAFVAAAGNSASNNDSHPMYPASYDVPNIISIAATTSSDNLASFSNFGKSSVHMGSPGVFILSSIPGGGYGSSSGTSMAAPFVSGVAALMKYESPTMLGYQIKSILFAQANTVTNLTNKVYTNGRVNSTNSINYAKNTSVDGSQPNYTLNYQGSRELASSLAEAGGCGMVAKLAKDGGGPSNGGPQSWSVLLLIAIMTVPMLVWQMMRERNPENRRRFERFNIASDVRVKFGEKELVGSVSTISLGGLQLNTEAMLENGGIVAMTISSPDGKEQVQVEGKVVWSEAKKAYGVAFERTPFSTLERIQNWTRSLTKA